MRRARSIERVVLPVLARCRGSAGERPQAKAFVVHAEEVRKAADGPVRIGAQPRIAVQQVLGRVVCRIADKRLRVDDEPRLAPRTKDVACVQIGRQQHVGRRTLRQFFEEAQTLADKARVGPVFRLSQRLVAPVRGHLRQRSKAVRRDRSGRDKRRRSPAMTESWRPRTDDAAEILAFRRHRVERRRRAEVDHDDRQALAVDRESGDPVGDAIGADLARVVDQDRHAAVDRRLEHQRHAAEVLADHGDQRPGQRRHDRRDDDAGDVALADLVAFAEVGDEDAELVGRPLADRRQAPGVDERLAAKHADHDVGVADVDC